MAEGIVVTSNVAAAMVPLGVSTKATQVGTSAGTALITATRPAGPADCGVGTTAAFLFAYTDPYGIYQTNYAGLSTAVPVSGNGINTYPLLDELCQFALTGPLGGFGGFGTSVPLTFYVDGATGCVPRNA